jgi:hypothetical protein
MNRFERMAALRARRKEKKNMTWLPFIMGFIGLTITVAWLGYSIALASAVAAVN